jgi:hypothetical protein
VGRLSNLFRNPFSFMGTRSQTEDRMAAYIIREHGRGRSLDEIVGDPYIRNHADGNQMLGRVLERPEVIHAIGADVVRSAQQDAL